LAPIAHVVQRPKLHSSRSPRNPPGN
jgi:hypothetical protein